MTVRDKFLVFTPVYITLLMFWAQWMCSAPHIDEVYTNDYVEIVAEPVTVEYDTIHLDRATTYNAVAGQCDDDPFGTADGSRINPAQLKEEKIKWVALSRDLIYDEYRDNLFSNNNHWRGKFKFGSVITIESESNPQLNGSWEVHDCMNSRYSNSIDFLFDPANNKPKLGVCKDIKIIYHKDSL